MFNKVKEILVTQFNVEESAIKQEAKLKDDLNLDSLDQVELVLVMEEQFGMEISDEDSEGLTTVGEIVAYLENL